MIALPSRFRRGGHRAAATAPPHASVWPSGQAVHVLEHDARIRLDDGLLLIEPPNGEAVRLRLPELLSVSIHGSASITTPAVQALLREGVPLIWRSGSGHYLGQTLDLSGRTARVRRAQYAACGSALGDAIAKALIGAKLANMRALLRRRAKGNPRVADAVVALDRIAASVSVASDTAALRGLEGAASAGYFACWPELLQGPAAGLPFPGRCRRPPIGVVNVLLSYSYAVLAGHCMVAAMAAGLDPAEGFLHVARAGRASLALDLMEPFRPAVAESTVLSVLNRGQVGAGDIIASAGGAKLSEHGRRVLLDALERRLEQAFDVTQGRRVSYRVALDLLARSLDRVLCEGNAALLAVPVRR